MAWRLGGCRAGARAAGLKGGSPAGCVREGLFLGRRGVSCRAGGDLGVLRLAVLAAASDPCSGAGGTGSPGWP